MWLCFLNIISSFKFFWQNIHNTSVQFEVKEYGKICFLIALAVVMLAVCLILIFIVMNFQFFPNSR